MYIDTYIYVYVYIHTRIHVYIYIEREMGPEPCKGRPGTLFGASPTLVLCFTHDCLGDCNKSGNLFQVQAPCNKYLVQITLHQVLGTKNLVQYLVPGTSTKY